MFWNNARRRLTSLAIQLELAEKPGISNIAKSSYYRAAGMLLCSLVEGAVYQLVKYHTGTNGNIVERIYEHQQVHQIPANAFSTPDLVFICKRIPRDVRIDDNGVTFGKLNIFLKNGLLITKKEYKLLRAVQKERNRIHLQGLSHSDTGYTKAKLQQMSRALSLVLSKLP